LILPLRIDTEIRWESIFRQGEGELDFAMRRPPYQAKIDLARKEKCDIAGATRCVIGHFRPGTGNNEYWAGDRWLRIPMTFLPKWPHECVHIAEKYRLRR